MVKTSVMGVTRCRICGFEMGTVAGGQGSGGSGTTASCRPCVASDGGLKPRFPMEAKLPVRHPGGQVGCNRSSKPVAQCIPATDRLSMMGVVCPGSLPALRFKPELGRVFTAKYLICLVGAPRFELGTPSPPVRKTGSAEACASVHKIGFPLVSLSNHA
jgi:hypothetical protein